MTISSPALSPLSPTERTRLQRGRDRAATDRAALRDLLDEGLFCHLAVVVDDTPMVLPTAYAVDWDGPDAHGTLYVHGSVAARSLRAASRQTVCVNVTVLDGLVLARSGFHHSANYRSAVVFGRPRRVLDDAERQRALDLVVDHLVPGRSGTLRRPTRKELAATEVLALSLQEASLKQRSGGPNDDPEDVVGGSWAGVVPLEVHATSPRTADDAPGAAVPDHVARRAADLRVGGAQAG